MDYKKIGLKVGIEIHQQLDTGKLFCRCPTILRSDEPDLIIKRKQHAVAGELGEIDVAAAYEAGRMRSFIYEGYSDTNCEIEFDDAPPQEADPEALKISLQIALLLNAKPLEYSQIMRKTVIDGSNTSGFQRTLLIARDGWIEVEGKRIGIDSICLEEDAGRIIKQDEKTVTYRIDRLGIPLVEIATSPDISEPEEARKVAEAIGEVLRAVKIKRGLGTIRQDVNLSIAKGARTEIKGVQDLSLIPKVIEKEVERQLDLIGKKKKVEKTVRRANEDGSTSLLRPLPGGARMYPETDLPLIKFPYQKINEIKASLPKLRSEIRAELKEKGLHQEMISILLKQNKLDDFKELLQIYNKPNLIARMLALFPKEISSHEKIDIKKIEKKLNLDILETILNALKKGKISEENIKQIMEEIVKGKSIEEALKIEKIKEEDIEKIIEDLVKEKPNLNINAYMGFLMEKFKGKIDGKKIMEILKRYVK